MPADNHPIIELHHRLDGPPTAPVLVLGPSLGTDLHLFDQQVVALADHYRILRYDLPGHGDSPSPNGPYTMAGLARNVISLLNRLGISQFHYAGVSIGAAIGQQLAVDYPDRVRSLTAIASSARFSDPASWPDRAATVLQNGTTAIIDSRPGTWFIDEFATTDEAAHLLEMLRATTREGYAGCCEAIATFDLRERLGDITVPVLAIAGEQDPATPPEMVRRIADGVANGWFTVIKDSAHLLNAEKPEQVNTLLLEHLAWAETVTGAAINHQ
jgi:3-oxoadipate enol-lactonase